MVNIFIVDSYSKEKGFKESKSCGYWSVYQPYVLLDYIHIDKNGFVLFHEMVHAFGLSHIGASGSSINIFRMQELRIDLHIGYFLGRDIEYLLTMENMLHT